MAPKDDDKPLELMAETETKMTNNGKNNGKDSTKSKSKSNKKNGGKNSNNGDIIDDTNAMSDEDRALKERLETCVSTLINEAAEVAVTPAIRLKAIDVIVTELRSATASMTSVPKPLKFLRPKYDILKGYYNSIALDKSVEGDKEMIYLRARLGDVLAVLAMTLGKHGTFVIILSTWFNFLLIGWKRMYFLY
jgi:26S proteasome regulatory subunit N1